MNTKQILKRILPQFVIELWRSIRDWKTIRIKRTAVFNWESECNRKIAAIKDKEVLTVLFLPANLGMWKYESLFRKMMEHPRFRPLVLPSPMRRSYFLGEGEQEKEAKKMRKFFSEKGYPVINDDDAKTVNPDIVFLTQGYDNFVYGLKDFPNALGCYVPYYSFPDFPKEFDKNSRDNLVQNELWRLFTINKATYDGRVAVMTNKGKNVRIVGDLSADRFLQKDTPFSFPWKLKNPALKKVIYAPHWTAGDKGWQSYSTFLSMGEVMLELAEKYADKIQWCFKPHPWLLQRLKELPEWGEERALAYFKRWDDLENGTYTNDEYTSLFMTSDAMVHDCGAFRFEYLYTKKPVMFLVHPKNFCYTDVAKQAVAAHYPGRSHEDVENFLREVVLGGNDPKFEERERFFNEHLLPPNNHSVAQNIIDEIERGLGWRK